MFARYMQLWNYDNWNYLCIKQGWRTVVKWNSRLIFFATFMTHLGFIYSNVYRVDQEIKTGHLVTSLSNKNNVYKNMVTPG